MLICARPARRDPQAWSRRHAPAPRLAAAALAGAALLAGCAPGQAAGDAPGDDGDAEGRLRVATSFYALQYVTERVGGDLVDVFSLTPPGVDPHEVELSPRQVRELGSARAVVTLSGFQPPVDEAVAARAPEVVLDVLEIADLAPAGSDHAHDEAAHDHHDHADEDDDHADHDDQDGAHDHGALAGLDPHFWLDPTRMVSVAHGVAETLAQAAPEHAEMFAAAAERLEGDLMTLDADYREGLAQCERDVVVTGHTAFGYLARAYGFTEVGLAGIDPENEPSPARLREVRQVLDDLDLTTVYATGPGDASVVATVADASGLQVGSLDPLEIQADADADYLDVMRANLDALRTGLGCA